MTRHIISTILLLISTVAFGQKNIILTKYPQKVPNGKKWVLPLNKALLIEVNEGTLVSGTLCSAKFLTRNPSISAVIEGQYGRPNKVYGISFRDLSKVAYANGVTFSITPVSFSSYDYNSSQDGVTQSKQNIVFYGGQSVYITECLESLQAFEYTLSANEIAQINQKEKKKKELELQRKKEEDLRYANEQEQERISNFQNNAPFRTDELENKPFLIRTDDADLKAEILKLPFDRDNTYFNIKFDTTGKMLGVIIDYIGAKKSLQPDTIAYKFRTSDFVYTSDASALNFFKTHFKLSEAGLALIKSRKRKVNFILPVQLAYYGGKVYLRLSYFYDEAKEYSFDYRY